MLRILIISLFVANLLLLGFRDDKPAVQPEPKAARTVIKSNNIPTIHLFSEMMKDQDLLSGNRQCFSLGPFHTTGDKDETRLLLLEVSTRISERQTQALVEKGYWVFMPPYESLLAANQALFSLQALGLEDIGIVHDGDLKNSISMGYFMRQENALSRKEGLEDRGYEPMIRVQRQPEPRYWLDYEQTPGSGLVSLDMQNRPNDFMQRPLPCPEEELFEPAAVESTVAEADIAPVEEAGVEDDALPDEGTDTGTVDSTVVAADNAPAQEVETEDDALPDEGTTSGAVDSAETAPDNAPAQEAGVEDDTQSGEGTGTDTVDSIVTTDDNAPVEEAGVEDDTQSGEGTGTNSVDPIVTVTDAEPAQITETEEGLPSGQDTGIDAAESVENLPENDIEEIPGEGAGTEPEEGAETEKETGSGDGTGEG